VVGNLKSNLPEMKDRLSIPVVDLKLVMDQSVHVESAIHSLTMEGVLGAVLCPFAIPRPRCAERGARFGARSLRVDTS
jgi:multidrug efflux pump subunit AcrB